MCMAEGQKIQFDLIKLRNGDRLLRLTDPPSGLSLERKLNPDDAVALQKNLLLKIFAAALSRAAQVEA